MRASLGLVLAVAACGRIDFDSSGIPDLVVRYAMDDDPSAGTIVASVAAYDGTCTACPSATIGVIDGGYMFDGTRAVLLPAISASLVGTAPYTVTVWIRAAVPPMIDSVVEKPIPSDSTNAFKIDITVTGDAIFETATPSNDFASLEIGSAPVVGAWHHVATSWDGATKRGYLDGALAVSASAELLDSMLPLQIGGDLDFGVEDSFYIGAIDDLRFYSRALEDAEIAQLAAM